MIAEERRAILLKELNDSGYVQATELASRLNLSAATIRRDFSFLEKQGLCFRKHGGAVRTAQGVTLELPYETKQIQRVAEKRRIAEAAAKLVHDGDTLILDAGSTTYALALLLLTKQRITVVTNDLQIACKLASNPNIRLICTGGIARPSVFSLQGSQVESFVKGLRVDMTFLGADAIHSDQTVTNVNFEEVPIKQAMLHAAEQVFLLADSTKFEKTGFVKVCDLSEINAIITDSGIPQHKLAQYKSLGLNVVVV
jgi:DeoR/GlpR family transcriptional regulator of sugar metabolism